MKINKKHNKSKTEVKVRPDLPPWKMKQARALAKAGFYGFAIPPLDILLVHNSVLKVC